MRSSVVVRALVIPRLSSGVSPQALGMCWGPTALVAILIGTSAGWLYALIPAGIGAIVHAVLRWAFHKDHRVFDIYARYALLANEYHPHSREKLPQPFERPHKVGRGVRI